MECIYGLPAMQHRVGERLDDLVELDNRTWPSVGHHQGSGLGVRRPNMNKVNAESVNLRLKLRESIEKGFTRPPVVFFQPVGYDLSSVGQRQALRPIVNTFTLRPSRIP